MSLLIPGHKEGGFPGNRNVFGRPGRSLSLFHPRTCGFYRRRMPPLGGRNAGLPRPSWPGIPAVSPPSFAQMGDGEDGGWAECGVDRVQPRKVITLLLNCR